MDNDQVESREERGELASPDLEIQYSLRASPEDSAQFHQPRRPHETSGSKRTDAER